MSTFEYYRQRFPEHRDEVLRGEPVIRHFPLPLETLPEEDRSEFVACLFIQVFADQVVHSHFAAEHPRFERATLFPKMGSGLAAGYPHYLLEDSVHRGTITLSDLIGPLFSALALMFSECHQIFAAHVPALTLDRFYGALMTDTHVKRWTSADAPEVLQTAHAATRAAFETYNFLKGAESGSRG